MFDTLFLSCSLTKNVIEKFISVPVIILHLCSLVVYPGIRFSFTSSIYTTVALSHSRYCATNNPIAHRNDMNSQSYRIKYFCKYIVVIIIFSVIVTLPCPLEFEIIVLNNSTSPFLTPSSLRLDPYYSIFYVGILSLGVNGIVPFSLLVYFTINIARGIRQNTFALPVPTNPQERENITSNHRNKCTCVVNVIVLFFLCIHLLRLGITIAEFVIQVKTLNNKGYAIGCNEEFWLNVFASISDLFIVINSSVNTVIYKVVFWKNGPTEEPRPVRNNEFQMTSLRQNRNSTPLVTGQSNSNVQSGLPTTVTTESENTITTSVVNRNVPSTCLDQQTCV